MVRPVAPPNRLALSIESLVAAPGKNVLSIVVQILQQAQLHKRHAEGIISRRGRFVPSLEAKN